jgi:hypothetical protein
MTAMGERTQSRSWPPLLEALGVFLLIMGYIWWLLLSHAWTWIALLGLLIGTHVARREGPGQLGFGWTGFRAAFPVVLPAALALCLILLGVGAQFGTLRHLAARTVLVGVAWYILWGLCQQYLLNGYFLNRLEKFGGAPGFAPVCAAVLFSLAHLPNWFLMAVTLAGGWVCARLFLRYRNLYVLAIAHGIVAFCIYLAVPDSVTGHLLVGPRYLIEVWGVYPEWLL